MKYDFTTMPDRTGRVALAVDAIGANVSWAVAPTSPKEGFSKLPMWVADMNFATVPTIPEAIIKRAEHPLYGYYIPTDEYYHSIIRWHEQRNGVTGLSKRDIGYENGVLGCVSTAIQAFTAPGEKVLLHSPTYIGFTHVLEDTGRVAELIRRGWDVGVAWQQGAPFHDPWGIRMNLALPYAQVVEAFDRLKKYVF